MTRDNATQVIADYDSARLKTCCGSGQGTAFDRLAAEYKISGGEAMSMYYEARGVIEHGAVCPTCKGKGRV